MNHISLAAKKKNEIAKLKINSLYNPHPLYSTKWTNERNEKIHKTTDCLVYAVRTPFKGGKKLINNVLSSECLTLEWLICWLV